MFLKDRPFLYTSDNAARPATMPIVKKGEKRTREQQTAPEVSRALLGRRSSL